jgi:acyl transferase domain-containing protein/NADPH:quinone reductase-like Zn-dependent oxidoreductase/acyl carrier protein
VAGLIKAALCLQHRAIPASLHFETPNPYIPWDELPLQVAQAFSPWPVDGEPALAGINSFGISGTNVHVVLQEAPLPAPAETIVHDEAAYLFPLSAHTSPALAATVQAYRDFLDHGTETSSIRDLCYSASLRRTHHAHRLAFVVHSRQELAEQMAAYQQGDLTAIATGVVSPGEQHKLVFVFSGQGPTFWPLDRSLLAQEPVFRATLEQCEALLQRYNVDWSLLAELTRDDGRSRLHETTVCQAAIFATQVALAALWRSWGIVPAAVVGHSLGEVAAAHVAGALSLEEAIGIVYHRGRITAKAAGHGRMGLVGLSLTAAEAALAGYEDRLAVAVNNSPTSSVLSGDPGALAEVMASLQQTGVFCRELPAVDYAAHSPQMEPLKTELAAALADLRAKPTTVPIYSTVTAKVEDGQRFGAAYWADNLRRSVRFSDTLQALLAEGYDLFLEVHPHQVLARAIQEGLNSAQRQGRVLPSLQRGAEGRALLLGSAGALYTCGYPIHWQAIQRAGGRHVALPNASVAWQRERYWIVDGANGNGQARGPIGQGCRHPLLGWRVSAAAQPGTHLLETELSTKRIPYLGDHRVQGSVILPATAYVEMALAAAEEVFGPGPHILADLSFQKALFLPEQGAQQVQLALAAEMAGRASIQFFSRPGGDSDRQGNWTRHASGTIYLAQADTETPPAAPSPTDFQAQATDTVAGVDHYRTLVEHGLDYGPVFQGVGEIWRQDGQAMARLDLPETVTAAAALYQIHPALLDACFQVLAAAIPQPALQTATQDTFLPVGLKQLRIHRRPSGDLFVHAALRSANGASQGQLAGDQLVGDISLLDAAGEVMVEVQGLTLQRLGLSPGTAENLDEWLYEIQWQPQQRPEPAADADTSGIWLIFADPGPLEQTLAAQLRAHGAQIILVTPDHGYRQVYTQNGRSHYGVAPDHADDMRRLLEECSGTDQPPLRGILYLWGLDQAASSAGDVWRAADGENSTLGLLHLVQALAQSGWQAYPRLWVITRGTQCVATRDGEVVSLTGAPLWGLARVVVTEHPELRCCAIDLAAETAGEAPHILAEILAGSPESQIALRGEERYVARLVRFVPEIVEPRRPAAPDEAYQLEVTTPGILDNFTLRAVERRAPAPGQVEIQVRAAGLNFLDVLTALGMRPDQDGNAVVLGMECAGVVSAVGEGVEGIAVGDEVIASAPYSFAAYTHTLAPFVVPKPAHLSFVEAATIPVAFLTAHYALNTLGRLRKGERILIHAAAGGVGLAAVRLAQAVGAEIFATASQGKHAFLRSLGIQHIMDSRSLAFADEVMAITHGEGVDVVLNSLAGEAIPRSLSLLRANGRFLEIGKRDIYEHSRLDMGHFKKNIAFFAIDLIPMFSEQPEFCGDLLSELMGFFAEGAVEPIPHTVFPISQVAEAFRYMAQARHIGKVVLSMADENVMVAPPARTTFGANGAYLITGGLGALGLAVAGWMVGRGAHHLVLMGRRAPAPAAAEAMAALAAQGAHVVAVQADVAQEDEVAAVLDQIEQTMPPLRGVIHAAGILDDGILLHLNTARLRAVMAPKVDGGWLLHRLTQHRELDHFILFSSLAAVFGSPGQGNYVAANTFLDALAHHRRLQGQPAVSINWGAWAEVGLSARADRVSHITQQGILPFTPQQGVQLLERILHHDAVQMAALAIEWPKLLKSFSPPFLAEIAATAGPVGEGGDGKKAQSLQKQLLALAPDERHGFVETFLRDQIAKVLRASADKLDVHQPLDQLGIDSLMAYELKNRVESDLNLTLPVAALLQGPSIAKLTSAVLEQLSAADASPAAAAPAADADDANAASTTEQLSRQIDELSDEEVEAMLHELLEEEKEAL